MSNNLNFQGAGGGPLTLSLDTATERRGVVVLDGTRVVVERSSDLRETGAANALVEIDAALREASLKVRDVELFALAVGPGSFTGLRAGIATMKALAATLGKPVVGVPTLHAVAHAAGPAESVAALIPAGRGEVFAQFLSVSPSLEITELGPPAHLPPARVVERARAFGGGLRWAGGGARKHLQLIKEAARAYDLTFDESGGANGVWSLSPTPDSVALSVGLVARERFRRGADATAPELRPIYVRPSDAELHAPCQAPA